MKSAALLTKPSVLESQSKSTSSAVTQHLTTKTRQRRCALPMTMSSMFGAEQRISKRSSARAVHSRRHTPATQNVWLEARVCICNRPVIVYGNPTTDRKATIGKVVYSHSRHYFDGIFVVFYYK